MKSFIKRLRNISLVFVLLIWQVVFAGAPLIQSNLAHAASIPSNEVSISSEGFVLGHNVSYSDVNGQPTGAGQFQNGNVNNYPEGSCIPIIFDVTNTSNSTGDTVVSPVYDYFNNVVGVQDYELVTYSGNGNPETDDTNLNQLTYTNKSLSNYSSTSFNLVGGGTVNASISGPYSGNNAGTTSAGTNDAQRHYNIQLTALPAGATAQILLCGRLGLDASQYNGGNGASLSFRTYQGGQENVAIPVNQILVLPSITVTKTVVGGSATASDFTFTISPDPNNTEGTTYTIPSGQNSVIIPNVNPDGNYTITESGPSNYVFSSGSGTSCSVVQASLGTAAGKMTAAVAAGTTGNNGTIVNATCNFTNTFQTGHITITKVVKNNNGGTAAVSDFPLYVNGTQVTSGVSNSYTANQSYTISEKGGPSGYHQDSISCVNTANNSSVDSIFTLSSNENVSCTITNSDIAPKLTLVKDVTGGTAVATDWTLSATPSDNHYSTLGGAGGFSEQTARANLDYTLGESGGPSGYTASSWDCNGGTLTGNTLKLALADDVTCTITNTRDTGTLTVNKLLVPSSDSGLFDLSMTGPTSYTKNDQGNNGSTGAQTVDTGSYTVSETAGTNTSLSNYFSSYSCVGGQTAIASGNATTSSSFDVTKGQSIVCTFTNTRYSSISGFKYEVNSDSSTVGALQSWTIYLYDDHGNLIGTTTTNSLGNFVFNNLLAGSYTLGENLENGWTQIYSPSGVTLSAGQNSTNNNFGNFQNAEISGMKFNDVNGNHQKDTGESGLSGWTINLSKSDGNGGWTADGSTVTGSGGTYSFTDLAPGDYKLCETGQTGWVQTYPTTNSGCNLVTVALSGHNYTDTNFGNQGQGMVTVVKNVDDGFGNITKDVTNWTWGYDGMSYDNDLPTGSSNSQTLAAGDYSIWENSQNDYHFTSVSCSNDTGTVTVDNSSQFDVSLDPGENLTCTFTNTRDTGTITVIKELYPSSDSGKFNLQINGQSYATNVGDQGTTGAITVVTGNDYNVSETAGTGTSLSDYQSDYWCNNDQGTYGQGTQSSDFSVSKDQNITCIFENIRLGTLTGEKFNDLNGNGQKDSGEPGLQGWTINLYNTTLGLNLNTPIQTTSTDSNGDYTFNDLPSGDYRVCEVQQSGWTQTYPGTNGGCTDFTINIAVDDETGQPGQVVTADFGNFQNGTISGFKFSDANGNGKYEPNSGDVKLSGWTITLSKSDGNGGWTQINSTVTDSSGDYSFTNLAPGDYQVCEVPQTGWIRIFPTGSNCQTESINQSGQTVSALFANQKQTTPKVLGAVTPPKVLANTGQSAWAGVVAGLTMLSLILGINLATPQTKKQR